MYYHEVSNYQEASVEFYAEFLTGHNYGASGVTIFKNLVLRIE